MPTYGRRGTPHSANVWKVGARLFHSEILTPPLSPCPFRGPHYQLMRNLTFAAALARLQSRPEAGFLLAFVEQARSAGAARRTFEEFQSMLLPDVARRAGAISYEEIASIVARHSESDLADWIESRLRAGVAARGAE